jgi:hypothetical protein
VTEGSAPPPPAPIGEKDLAGGDVSALDEAIIKGQLSEEAQRRRWKTVVLWGSAATILLFYLAFLVYVLCFRQYWATTSSQNLIIGILAAVPTLLAINLVRMVSRSSGHEDDFERNPWVSLLRELIDALRQQSN